jgi:hypothetical protein
MSDWNAPGVRLPPIKVSNATLNVTQKEWDRIFKGAGRGKTHTLRSRRNDDLPLCPYHGNAYTISCGVCEKIMIDSYERDIWKRK